MQQQKHELKFESTKNNFIHSLETSVKSIVSIELIFLNFEILILNSNQHNKIISPLSTMQIKMLIK